MEKSDQKKLIKELLELSESNDWAYAKLEWEYFHIFSKRNFCICGHPILDNCVIRNIHNGNKAIVGNSCIKKFMDINLDGIFIGLKNIKKDKSKSVSKKLLEHCYKEAIIDTRQYKFYVENYKKRKLTQAQLRFKLYLNYKIFNYFVEGNNE